MLSGQVPNSYSSAQEEIFIKNLDSGMSESFLQVEEIEEVCSIKDIQSNEMKMTHWNSYFEQQSKVDTKLLKLIIAKDKLGLIKLLKQQPIELNNYIYINGWTLLHHAVVSSTEDIVQLLIQNRIDINRKSSEMQRTPLHEAVKLNKPNIVDILILNKANPNLQDLDGNTPCHFAAELSYSQIFQSLLTSSIKIDFSLRNHQQMTVIDCIRDQKMFQTIAEIYPQMLDQNQNLSFNPKMQNRRIIVLDNQTMIKRLSKSDMIEKFLSLKSIPVRMSSEDNVDITKNQQLIGSIRSEQSNSSKNKKKKLGKRPSNWIQKKGHLITSQTISLMKQSILEQQEPEIQFSQSMDNYSILRFIGAGGFAQVFLARRKRSTKLFAIKRISKAKILQNNLKRYVYAQRNIMIKCQHPFVVEAFSMFQDQVFLYISMQYCQCGDLQKFIQKRQKLPQSQAKLYGAQIGLALEHIHSQNILFRDLKPANVLIGKDRYLKISDFGLAKESLVSFSFLGSLHYLAPEMLVQHQMKQHTKSIDWYLFGVCLYEMLTGHPLFYGEPQHILFKKIKQTKPPLPQYLSNQCKDLLSRLLQKDPSKRLGSTKDFKQIQSMPWFKDIDFSKILKKQYEMGKVQPLIKQGELHKKMDIDDFRAAQKYEYFKQWNYIRPE